VFRGKISKIPPCLAQRQIKPGSGKIITPINHGLSQEAYGKIYNVKGIFNGDTTALSATGLCLQTFLASSGLESQKECIYGTDLHLCEGLSYLKSIIQNSPQYIVYKSSA
jgi:hypothetical protein